MKGTCIFSIILIGTVAGLCLALLTIYGLQNDFEGCKRILNSERIETKKKMDKYVEFESKLGKCFEDNAYLKEKVDKSVE